METTSDEMHMVIRKVTTGGTILVDQRAPNHNSTCRGLSQCYFR